MEPQNENTGEEKEIILYSPYKDAPMPTLTEKTFSNFILGKAQENVKIGRTSWLTNSVTGEELTFADAEPMSRKCASAMVKRGMKKGDVAIYLTMNPTKIYTTMIGVWRIGGIMHSSYPEDTQDTLLLRIQQTKAKWVFCDSISIPSVQQAIESVDWSVEIIVFHRDEGCTSTPIEELYEDDGEDCPAESVGELDDPALILCTSGTTGKSKGAIYTNRCLMAFCVGAAGLPYHEKPAILVARCTHVLGCLFPLRNLMTGVHSILLHEPTKINIFKAVDKYKPCLAFGFPTFLALLVTDPEAVNYDFSSLEIICTGGIVLTPQYYELMMSLPNMKAVINGYGMTECGVMTTTVDINKPEKLQMVANIPYLSVGRLYANSAIKILDVETGRTLGPNKSGEIAIKSRISAAGYWQQPEETLNTFRDGWLRTGDLGYYDDDGNIYVVDRIKETFKHVTNWVSPAELEEVMLRHQDVKEVSCFGVPDPETDCIPRAVVVLNKDATVTPNELRDFVDSQVASYKRLRGGVYIVSALPRGKTGKVTRALVASMDLTEVPSSSP